MKGHVKSKLQPWQLAKDSFMDSLPLLRRELPLISSGPATFLSPRCAQPLWSLWESGYFTFKSYRWWSAPKLCRCFGLL
jgi:hypothetical protein